MVGPSRVDGEDTKCALIHLHTNQSSIIQPCSPAQLSRRLVQWEVLGQYGITLNVNLCVRHHRLRRRFAQISFLVLELGPTLLPCKMQ